ncbi:uncharacterized protein TRAVEDRAFT_25305 [Trametes versicolor FP-101664 SS1]|uniref:uncharacterized protein n=1 Tax=Trametes versicolor (strain FP-101664) TaxID=717944 RepID=UPI0004623F16|nr:uncharacterized protein TRAVEDRAFT_25305 [Trametes versicolor FP-101664 SS1]EIW63948.1 hypothetical protein TRAVEDRAFT_25305 [Trametes versicolor FP-101664 SS1]
MFADRTAIARAHAPRCVGPGLAFSEAYGGASECDFDRMAGGPPPNDLSSTPPDAPEAGWRLEAATRVRGHVLDAGRVDGA